MVFEDQKEELVENLIELMGNDDDEGFLTVSAGDYYVQFVPVADDEAMYIEAVSNEFLSNELMLSDEQISMLADFGFDPPNGSPNFSMTFDASVEEAFEEMVELVFEVLEAVYCIDGDCPLTLDLTLTA